MPDLTKSDIQGWLVIVDPNSVYQPKNLMGYDRIQFTYQQDNFSESKSANYSSTAILGRSEPVRGYLGSSPRAINLQLMIPPDGDGAQAGQKVVSSTNISYEGQVGLVGDPTNQNTSYTISNPTTNTAFARKLQVIDFIRSLVYPFYGQKTNEQLYPPPRVLMYMGSPPWFSLIGIVTSYNMVHRAPWASILMAPYFTEVSITIEECDVPYSFSDVYTGALQSGGLSNSKVSPSGLSSRIG
jgi:hypothetical protein